MGHVEVGNIFLQCLHDYDFLSSVQADFVLANLLIICMITCTSYVTKYPTYKA
jgi:hypothetical protein